MAKTRIRLKNSINVTAVLDTDVEINVITREIMKDISLAIWQSLKLELVFHTGHNHLFLGFYEDVEVVIRGLKTRHPIFVVEYGDHDLVLDQFFLNLVKLS